MEETPPPPPRKARRPRPESGAQEPAPRKPPPAKATHPGATPPEATGAKAVRADVSPDEPAAASDQPRAEPAPQQTTRRTSTSGGTPPASAGRQRSRRPAKRSPAPSAAGRSPVAETASEPAAPETVPDGSAADDPASIVDVSPTPDPPATTPPDTVTTPPSTEPVERTGVPAGVAHVSGGLWARLRDEPGQAREVLARVAVEVLGPRARVWAAQTREAYPQVGAADVARLAVRRAGRNGLVGGAVAALSGAFAPATSMVAAAWTQTALVLEVAAAYGVDPSDEERVAEVLEITGTRDLGMPIVAQVTGWFALRTVNRILPGSALLAATLGGRAAAQRVGARAVAFYSQESQAFGNRV